VANADILKAGKLLDEIAAKFPRAATYRTQVAIDIIRRVGDLAQLANDVLIAAVNDARNITYKEQLDPLPEALWRDVQPLLDERMGPVRKAQVAHTPMVTLPTLKDDLERAILRIKATFEQLAELDSIRPWWAEHSGAILKALGDLYEWERKVLDLAGHIGLSLPWIGAGVAALVAVIALARRRRAP
jgi:hypothetical protein